VAAGSAVAGGNIDLVPGAAASTAANGAVRIGPSIAVSANGVTSGSIASRLALIFGSSGPGIYVGSSTPSVVPTQGSLYIRTDGSSTSTRLYVYGSAAWIAVTTAS
jgi:hypothetical protein